MQTMSQMQTMRMQTTRTHTTKIHRMSKTGS
jgi:hypothetical protein